MTTQVENMAIHCNSAIRFFLHTFLFVNNSSAPPTLTSTDPFPLNGNKSVSDWLEKDNGTGSSDNRDFKQVLECLQMYVLPVIISVGVGGSALGVAVLLGTFLRFKFFTHFLVCLNVSSAAFLLTVLLSWLADNGIDIFSAPGLCQVHVFSSHFFTFLTVWHSVLGAYLVLTDWLKPGAVPWLHSPTAAKTAVLGLSVLGFTMYSYKTWTHFTMQHRGSRLCTVIPENKTAMEILNVLDVLVLLVFPSLLHLLFLLIVLFSRLRPPCRCLKCVGCCWTLRSAASVYKSGRERVLYTCPSGDVITELNVSVTRCSLSPRCREVHRLVVSQSACFLLLVMPRAVSMLVVTVHHWIMQQSFSSDEILLQHVFQFIFYLYFTVLPFCPAFASSKFRLHCCSLFKTSSTSSSSSSSSSSSKSSERSSKKAEGKTPG